MSNNYNRNNQNRKPSNNQSKQAKPQQKSEPKDIMNLYFDAESRIMGMTATLNVYGVKKTGNFTFKYPSISDRIRIGTLRAQMLDGAPEQSIDNLTSDLTYIVAFLRLTMKDAPDWFDFTDIDDVLGMRKMFNEVQEWVSNFRFTGGKCQRPGNSATSADEKDMVSDETVSSSN